MIHSLAKGIVASLDELGASTAWQKAEPRTVRAMANVGIFFIRIFSRLIVMGIKRIVGFFKLGAVTPTMKSNDQVKMFLQFPSPVYRTFERWQACRHEWTKTSHWESPRWGSVPHIHILFSFPTSPPSCDLLTAFQTLFDAPALSCLAIQGNIQNRAQRQA